MTAQLHNGTRYRTSTESPTGLWPGLCITGVCIPFLLSGIIKATHPAAATAEVAALGLPAAVMLAWLTVIVQLGGSAAAIWGGRRVGAFGALSLAIFTLLASVVAHAFWTIQSPGQTAELNVFMEHLSIFSGLLFVAWWKWTSGQVDE